GGYCSLSSSGCFKLNARVFQHHLCILLTKQLVILIGASFSYH
ncbi:unnamed protein product, partial [Musa acuminata subsp. burmannicoides]